MVCQIDIFLAVLYYRAGQFFLIDVNDCDFSSIVQQTTVLQAGIYHVFQERKQNGNIVILEAFRLDHFNHTERTQRSSVTAGCRHGIVDIRNGYHPCIRIDLVPF